MSDSGMEFKSSPGFTVGVELELQILNSRDYNLGAMPPTCWRCSQDAASGRVKPRSRKAWSRSTARSTAIMMRC